MNQDLPEFKGFPEIKENQDRTENLDGTEKLDLLDLQVHLDSSTDMM